jgi:hypothetical protein
VSEDFACLFLTSSSEPSRSIEEQRDDIGEGARDETRGFGEETRDEGRERLEPRRTRAGFCEPEVEKGKSAFRVISASSLRLVPTSWLLGAESTSKASASLKPAIGPGLCVWAHGCHAQICEMRVSDTYKFSASSLKCRLESPSLYNTSCVSTYSPITCMRA